MTSYVVLSYACELFLVAEVIISIPIPLCAFNRNLPMDLLTWILCKLTKNYFYSNFSGMSSPMFGNCYTFNSGEDVGVRKVEKEGPLYGTEL